MGDFGSWETVRSKNPFSSGVSGGGALRCVMIHLAAREGASKRISSYVFWLDSFITKKVQRCIRTQLVELNRLLQLYSTNSTNCDHFSRICKSYCPIFLSIYVLREKFMFLNILQLYLLIQIRSNTQTRVIDKLKKTTMLKAIWESGRNHKSKYRMGNVYLWKY